MNQREMVNLQRSERFLVAALLAVAGGFLDAYTYLCRGGVFANAETGNMVLLAVRAAEGNWGQVLHYLMPIGAFALGILTACLVRRIQRRAGRLHWRHTVLGVEMAVLVIASWIPQGELGSVVNVMVAFVCALQVEAFRKVRGNAFASTMCTGNLRSGTEALFHALEQHDRTALGKSICYFSVIACFLAGAALGGLISPRMPQRAILVPAALQLLTFILMCEFQTAEKKTAD